MTSQERTKAITVYCGSSFGTEAAYQRAAASLAHAMATQNRPLVYGGGSKGIMGVVSGSVLEHGGKVTGVIPSAMLAAGGEGQAGGELNSTLHVKLNEAGREEVETIVVHSMHERKVEMARRAGGFIGLPGGYGTFEEVFEAITWTQLGIHSKPVVLVNVLGFFNPLRALVRGAIKGGFIQPQNERLVIFVDGPADHSEHEDFDWGSAALAEFDRWEAVDEGIFKWTKVDEVTKGADRLDLS